MSNGIRPTLMVGNEFVVPRPRFDVPIVAAPTPMQPVISIPVVPDFGEFSIDVSVHTAKKQLRLGGLQRIVDFTYDHSIGAIALLLLLVGSTGTQVASSYISSQIAQSVPQTHVLHNGIPQSGMNMAVPVTSLAHTVQAATAQAVNITIGDTSYPVASDTIKSWLQVVTDQSTHTSYIHVKEAAIAASLQALATKHTTAPANQVSVTHDGSTSVIISGHYGLQVSVPVDMAQTVSKGLLANKGMQLALNSSPLAFQAVTPAAYPKLIEVNVDTKQMYLYDNGALTKSYPISAGKPSTPTPIGQYKIYEKLAVQDMRGVNPDGTPYFQPHVHWINYFLPGGYAVHGNYWRPMSWFGNINSSHGCVSLPDDQAKEVYDWAPLGTPVITHHA